MTFLPTQSLSVRPSIMKIDLLSSFRGTSYLRSRVLAFALWLGLSGNSLAAASEPFREFFVGGVPEGVLFDGSYLWVVDYSDNTVIKLQPDDGTIVGTFPTMETEPRYLAFDGENIWVTHSGEYARVSKLRASDGAFLGSFYGGAYPAGLVYVAGKIWVAAGYGGVILRASDGAQIGGFGGSFGVTFDGENVWATDPVLDIVQKYRASDAALLGTFDVGATPGGVAFDRGNIWVANFDDGTVTKLRASDGTLLGTFRSGDEDPQYVAVDRAGDVWVTHFNGAVTVLRARDGGLEKKYANLSPQNITSDGSNIWISRDGNSSSVIRFSPDAATTYRRERFEVGGASGLTFDGTNIWVAQDGFGTVTELRANDGTVVGVFPAGGSSNGDTYDGTYIWVLNDAQVTRLLQSDGSMQGSFPVGELPLGIVFDGTNIWVTNSLDNTVTKLRASDGASLGTFTVGSFPRGIAFDGENIWVANQNDVTVTKLRASDGRVQGTFTVGNAPYGIVFDGTYIWVSNSDDATVVKLNPADGRILDTAVVSHDPRGLAVDGTHLLVHVTQEVTR